MNGVAVLERRADDGAKALMEAASAKSRRNVRWIMILFVISNGELANLYTDKE